MARPRSSTRSPRVSVSMSPPRPDVRFRQVFPGRGGDIETETRGDRVLLRGRAVTVVESRLRIAP